MKASILINNYNNEKYIQECIESALNQTYPNIEVIVCDNGSTDKSMNIISKFQGKIGIVENLNRVKIHSQNQYLTIVEAYKKSTGDIIFLLDGDDVFLKRKVEEVILEFGKSEKIVMVQHQTQIIDEYSNKVQSFSTTLNYDNYLEHIINTGSIYGIFGITSTQAYKRELFEKLIFIIDEQLCFTVCTDYRLPMHAVFNGEIRLIDKVLGLYRRHSNNDSNRLNTEQGLINNLNENVQYFNLVQLQYGYQIPLLQPATKMYRYGYFILEKVNIEFYLMSTK
ncbi:hypothetical protein UACE39S_04170 [Ureibacillus acetophenoni]